MPEVDALALMEKLTWAHYGKYPKLFFGVSNSEYQTAIIILCHSCFKRRIDINFLQGRIDEGPLHLSKVTTLRFW